MISMQRWAPTATRLMKAYPVSGVAALRGLHATVPKLESGIGGSMRKVFSSGTPQFDDVRLEVGSGSAGATTAADVNDWIANELQPDQQPDIRDATVTLKKPTGQDAATLRLFNLVPQTALEPYSSASGRGAKLHLGSFDFVQP